MKCTTLITTVLVAIATAIAYMAFETMTAPRAEPIKEARDPRLRLHRTDIKLDVSKAKAAGVVSVHHTNRGNIAIVEVDGGAFSMTEHAFSLLYLEEAFVQIDPPLVYTTVIPKNKSAVRQQTLALQDLLLEAQHYAPINHD